MAVSSKSGQEAFKMLGLTLNLFCVSYMKLLNS
jgi:hypothetical protein